jgi:hypothetical protein
MLFAGHDFGVTTGMHPALIRLHPPAARDGHVN